MTIDLETVIRLANEVGFVGYGEDVGNFSIPVPAFYSRLERFAALVLEHGRKPLCWLQQDKFGNYHVADESWHCAFPVYGDQSEENKEPKK